MAPREAVNMSALSSVNPGYMIYMYEGGKASNLALSAGEFAEQRCQDEFIGKLKQRSHDSPMLYAWTCVVPGFDS